MSKGPDRLVKAVQQFCDANYKNFTGRYGQQMIDIFEFPLRVVLSPFTLAYDISGSAHRGFGIPKLISDLSFSAIFVSSSSLSLFISAAIKLGHCVSQEQLGI